jgi:putative membrane protein insertion efficiency factor
MTTRPSPVARLVILPIRGWQLVSRWLPPRCRFFPSCSQYAVEAITVHGAVRGGGMAVRRVGRCHPWHEGGVDPVPPNTRSLRRRFAGAAEESRAC